VTPEEFLNETLECFERASAHAGLHERDLVLGANRIRLRVAGLGLASGLFDSLYDPRPPEGEADATLHAFDSAAGSEVPPSPPWSPEDYLVRRDEVRGFTAGRFRAAFAPARETLIFNDLELGLGVTWVRDWRRIHHWDIAYPWRTALNWALGPLGLELVHAAAVGEVLVLGPSGTGKSTTATAAAVGGVPCSGEDYSVLAEGASGWEAHALYRLAKLDDAAVALLGIASTGERFDDKTRAELPSMVASMAVRAVVVPKRAARTGSPRPLSKAAALRAIGPSTLTQSPGYEAAKFEAMGRLVRAVPTLELEVGPDVDAIPDAIREAAAGAGARA